MKKIVRLTENDLMRIVRRVIKENEDFRSDMEVNPLFEEIMDKIYEMFDDVHNANSLSDLEMIEKDAFYLASDIEDSDELSDNEKDELLDNLDGCLKMIEDMYRHFEEEEYGDMKRMDESRRNFRKNRMNEESTTGMESTMGKDPDHFGMYVKPAMIQAGFKLVDESKIDSSKMCKYYEGNCCKYFCYPNHNDGVNLFLDCSDSGWKYVVFYKTITKEFGWKIGTEAEVKKAAQDAVNYAISLKKQYFK